MSEENPIEQARQKLFAAQRDLLSVYLEKIHSEYEHLSEHTQRHVASLLECALGLCAGDRTRFNSEIAKRIRVEAGFAKQKDLAKALGIEPPRLCEYEQGITRVEKGARVPLTVSMLNTNSGVYKYFKFLYEHGKYNPFNINFGQ